MGGIQIWLTLNQQKKELSLQQLKQKETAIRSQVKTAIKKVETAVTAGDKEAATAALASATSVISKAETKGVYHKNNASRKVARLAKLVNTIA